MLKKNINRSCGLEKSRNLFTMLCLITLCLVLSACAGGGAGTGTISVRIGGANARTLIEPEKLQYELILKSSGKEMTLTVDYASTVSVEVSAGTWELNVTAIDPANQQAVRGKGAMSGIQVTAGKQTTAAVSLTAYTEVNDWASFIEAVNTGTHSEIIAVTAPITTGQPMTMIPSDNPDRTVTVTSAGGARTIDFTGTGSLITVLENAVLVLENITLKGNDNNNAPLVTVDGGSLTLKTGAAITGNTFNATTANTGGAGVYVDGGKLEIAGGEISDNTINGTVNNLRGGGVYVVNESSVLMTGGSIKSNSVSNVAALNNLACNGGGINISTGSSFEMFNGTIENNSVNSQSTGGTAVSNGGGVNVEDNQSSFYFNGGVIRNNICHAQASNNNGSVNGGGVYFAGEFIMSGGIISGNSVTHSAINTVGSSGINGAYGGGVGSIEGLLIQKTGGVIYGNDVNGYDVNGLQLRNTAQDDASGLGGGYAIFIIIGNGSNLANNFSRNTTAYAGDNIDSSITGAAGGWE